MSAHFPSHHDDKPTGLRSVWLALAQFVWITPGLLVLTAVVALALLLFGVLGSGF